MTENFFDLEEASKKYWLAIDALDAAFEKVDLLKKQMDEEKIAERQRRDAEDAQRAEAQRQAEKQRRENFGEEVLAKLEEFGNN